MHIHGARVLHTPPSPFDPRVKSMTLLLLLHRISIARTFFWSMEIQIWLQFCFGVHQASLIGYLLHRTLGWCFSSLDPIQPSPMLILWFSSSVAVASLVISNLLRLCFLKSSVLAANSMG